MNASASPPRKRTFYLPKPDYTVLPASLPPAISNRLLSRLSFLYGNERARAALPELERIIQVHCAYKPPEMIEKEKHFIPSERFSEADMILITYGDIVRGEGKTPLAILHDFVNSFFRGAIRTIHLLPFFPYSSDRGFAIVDFTKVDPKLGNWQDIREHKKMYDLMFDAVLNHCSPRSIMFREYLNDNPLYRNFFIGYNSPNELTPDQRSKIFRPRTSDILTRFLTLVGPKYVWTTFSGDHVDFNFRNPDVLLRIVEGILFYIRRGADMLRLDAVTYIWADPGTECIHLPETHEIVKLIRDVVDFAGSGVALITETNVPHTDNISYFGNGVDEAHMVYNFALPPLVLHTFYREDATRLSDWVEKTSAPSPLATFFNILDTHDGIGLMGVKGILSQEDIDTIIRTAQDRGAIISHRMIESKQAEPYEINCTWWNAINGNPSGQADLAIRVRRYMASRCIALVLQGVPGIYIHSALGSANDDQRMQETGVAREINRGYIDTGTVADELKDSNSKLAQVNRYFRELTQARIQERAFHPNGPQQVLRLSPAVFSVFRSSPEGETHILALINVTSKTVILKVLASGLPVWSRIWQDVLTSRKWPVDDKKLNILMAPYEIIWLKPWHE